MIGWRAVLIHSLVEKTRSHYVWLIYLWRLHAEVLHIDAVGPTAGDLRATQEKVFSKKVAKILART